LPPWFAAIFGAVYLSGYLIEFFYYSSLGITDATSEILKLKYVGTGLTFFVLLLIIAIPTMVIIGRASLPIAVPTTGPSVSLGPWALGMTLFNFISIYCAILFAPLQYFDFDAHWDRWGALIGLVLLWVIYVTVGVVVDLAIKHQTEREIRNARNAELSDEQRIYLARRREAYSKIRMAVAWVLIGCIVWLDIVIFRGRFSTVASLFWPYGIFFAGFSILMGAQLSRVHFRLANLAQNIQELGETTSNDESDKPRYDELANRAQGASELEFANFRYLAYEILSSLGTLVLFVLALTSYAYVIFPFVPFSKGGADYEFARRVAVSTLHSVQAPIDLSDALILYSTSSSYYITTPVKGNDACDWRRHLATPNIVQLARAEVSNISFKTEYRNCFKVAVGASSK
jgi:hypothetical protein